MGLHDVVEQELFRMLARQLDYAPSADELPFTVQTMVNDLVQCGLRDSDAERVLVAFVKLGPVIDRWPTSRVVISAIPPKLSVPSLPSPRANPAKAEAELRKINVGHGRRSVFLPNESFSDYQFALSASGKDKMAFDAARLFQNGWRAENEKKYQDNAHICRMPLNSDGLLQELMRLETLNDPEAKAEREAIQAE